jgi:hypothetical protein
MGYLGCTVVFFFRWRYSPLWALACRKIPLHFSLSITNGALLSPPFKAFRYLRNNSWPHSSIPSPTDLCRPFQYYFKYIVPLEEQCHNSKSLIFQKLLKVLKCYNFLRAQQRRNCSPAASFANCVMTLYLLKVHLKTFLSILIIKKCQILSCDSILLGVWYIADVLNVSYIQRISKKAENYSTRKEIFCFT